MPPDAQKAATPIIQDIGLERVNGVDLVDRRDGFPTLRITRIATVRGRMYYGISTGRQTREFYVTRKGLLRDA